MVQGETKSQRSCSPSQQVGASVFFDARMAAAHAPELIPWLLSVVVVFLGVGVPVCYMYLRTTGAAIAGRRD